MKNTLKLTFGIVMILAVSLASSCVKETDFVEEIESPATDFITFQFESEDMIVIDSPSGLICSENVQDTFYSVGNLYSGLPSSQLPDNFVSINWDSSNFPHLIYTTKVNGQYVTHDSYGLEMSLNVTSETNDLLSGSFSGELYDSTITYVGTFTGTFQTALVDTCG